MLLITPPPKYKYKIEDLLNRAVDRLTEVVELPMFTPDGEVDVRVANLIHRVVVTLHQLVEGSVVQRSVNVNVEKSDVDSDSDKKIEDMDARLEELRKRVARTAFKDTIEKAEVLDAEVVDAEVVSNG